LIGTKQQCQNKRTTANGGKMRNNRWIYTLGAAGIAGLCVTDGIGAQEISKPSPPNIVLIIADDLGMGDIAAFGHPVIKTPVLDQMIREGTDYRQWTVASPVCSPMRASVLTGNYPSRFSIYTYLGTPEQNRKHGMTDWLDPNTTLLPRLLQDAGYTTAHFGKWHLSQDSYEAPHPKAYGYDRAAVWCAKGPSIFYKCPPTDDPLGFIEREAPEFLTAAAVNHSMPASPGLIPRSGEL
jgi:arylsulfatase A-like enzyme